MANVLYLDCFAGAAGDMLLGAMLDLGADVEIFETLLEALPIDDVEIDVEPTKRGALHAQLVKVQVTNDQPHRHWTEIDEMLAQSKLAPTVKENARRVFRRLAEAEGKVHGHKPDTVHFHEVGAIDAIVDIVGFCLALDNLGIDRIVASPLPLGRGEIEMAHGRFPLPAPATVALLADAPVTDFPLAVETVTPTGAALIATLAESFGSLPTMTLLEIGYGAGTRIDENGPPNVVRALLGDDKPLPETEEATWVLEANIDDMNPEYYEPLTAHLEEAGALDVTLIPCIMKRGRPGILLEVVSTQSQLHELIETIFTHSTTLGLRYYQTQRAACRREEETVETEFGPVRIKHAYYRDKLVNSKPEYADLAKSGLPPAKAAMLAMKASKKHSE